ncbi:DUF1310 domain-containing protein, partial [Streptococcus agalactiae]|nr:DUF1310 domain-containing protein [Streptococcus agalactiae]MCC9953382.1 DUF1310 domain-containing protein [Streptococcus agalactiae]HEO6851280.1 DUF1310 domain-containing protein [Streptococcus agalactiae]HEO7298256.1 DUF1310 domain-containing protein [Streptococcus agalactiae]
VIILLGLGFTVGGLKVTENNKQQELWEIANSKDAKNAYQKWIYAEDEDAFKENAVIKSYDIDKESIKKNPMGGISVRLIINKDPNLYITCNLDRDNQGHLVSQSSHQSPQLTHLLESRGH